MPIYCMATCHIYIVTVKQRFEAAYVEYVKMLFFRYARLDMYFCIWVFLQLALSFNMPGVDLLPAFRVIITKILDFLCFLIFSLCLI